MEPERRTPNAILQAAMTARFFNRPMDRSATPVPTVPREPDPDGAEHEAERIETTNDGRF